MAASPQFKVYNAAGSYRGSIKCPTEAAALLSVLGEGATLRFGHNKRATVYEFGPDGDPGESFDAVAEIVWARCHERWPLHFPGN